MGIEEKQLKNLFLPYVKIMRNRNLNKEGCGLGLTISRNLAQALGGDISVESELDQGSIFTLKLPIFQD